MNTRAMPFVCEGQGQFIRACCRAAQPSLKDGSQPMELVESSVVEPEG